MSNSPDATPNGCCSLGASGMGLNPSWGIKYGSFHPSGAGARIGANTAITTKNTIIEIPIIDSGLFFNLLSENFNSLIVGAASFRNLLILATTILVTPIEPVGLQMHT